MKQPTSESRYRRLVRRRRADNSLEKYGFTNPGDTRYEPKQLGSFARWAGIGYFIEKGIVVEQLPLLLFRSARLELVDRRNRLIGISGI